MYCRVSLGLTRGLLPIVGNRLRNSAPASLTVRPETTGSTYKLPLTGLTMRIYEQLRQPQKRF